MADASRVCVWQIVYAQLTQLLAAERSGQQLALQPYSAARVVRDAISHHVDVLCAEPRDRLPACSLDLLCKRSTIGPVAMETVYQHVRDDVMARATELATSRGLTLNALLLGSLASLLHKHSQSSRFAIQHTYLGRRADQLEAVGSFSTWVPMVFSFEGDPSLLHTCRHALRETLAVLKSVAVVGGAAAGTEVPSFAYELNDMRPMPRPASMPELADVEGRSGGVKLSDVFFIVNQYVDGYSVLVPYDAGMYERDAIEALVMEWMQLWVLTAGQLVP